MIFENLWEEYNIPLKNFIKRRVNNYQDVEDILQIVFLKIYNNINNLNKTSKIDAWIYTVTKNTITDYYRKRKHDFNIVSIPDDFLSEEQEEKTLNNEISQCLKTMIQYLPKKYKEAIILTEFENLTQKELAIRIGLSVSGAKSRVQRARMLLKEMLLDCCELKIDCRGNIIDYKVKNNNFHYC